MPTPRLSFGPRKNTRPEPAAAVTALFLCGTTEETKMVLAFRVAKVRRNDAALNSAVGIRIGFDRRRLVAKASFV